MTFEDKVAFLRSLPQFKVVPISEIRAVAFVANEATESSSDGYIIGKTGTISLSLSPEDIEKIVREYPNLESILK